MITTPITADLLFGAAELESTEHGLLPHRLPAWARAQTDDPQLAMVEAQPSGVRLRFRTRATVVELDTLPTRRAYAGLPNRPVGVYDLLVDGRLKGQATAPNATVITVDMATGAVDREQGVPGTISFTDLNGQGEGGQGGGEGGGGQGGDGQGGGGEDKIVEIWLPHNEVTELVALRSDAPLEPAPSSGRAVWLHHGSSISHGSDAASPSTTWPAIAAAATGLELINLGFGGGALLDPFTARVMRDTPADLISVKIGINLVNADLMRLRAFGPAVHGFLDTIRDGHPTTPLLVISPIHCPIHEDTPGPGAFDMDALREGRVMFRATGEPAPGLLTLKVIRQELARIVAQRAEHDPHLRYLDGLELYHENDAPLPDRLHPDAATHRLIGERFALHVPAKLL